MSERRRLEGKLETLGDIREIMSALRNTAVIETTRLRRLVPAQEARTDAIERAAQDFLSCYPAPALPPPQAPVVIVVGSERGFCGDFNEALQAPLAEIAPPDSGARVIAVGRRLATRLGATAPLAEVVEGASVADDVGDVAARLAEVLGAGTGAMQSPALPLSLELLYHAGNGDGGRVVRRQPFAALLPQQRSAPANPLRLHLPPAQMFAMLVEHYLLAALHGMLHTALLAENQRRLQHLDGAMRRIDHRCDALATRRNALRQEEITEEIEVILLSTGRAPGSLGTTTD